MRFYFSKAFLSLLILFILLYTLLMLFYCSKAFLSLLSFLSLFIFPYTLLVFTNCSKALLILSYPFFFPFLVGATTLKKHKPTNLCQWKSLSCWSPMHPIHQHWTPTMQTLVYDDNQPLTENIPTHADEGQESAQFFSNWEHSGSWFCCIEVEGRTRHA